MVHFITKTPSCFVISLCNTDEWYSVMTKLFRSFKITHCLEAYGTENEKRNV